MDADKEAKRIEKAVNDRIRCECSVISGYLWRSTAEEIAEQTVPPGWEWEVMEIIGSPPQFVLMSYDPRAAT